MKNESKHEVQYQESNHRSNDMLSQTSFQNTNAVSNRIAFHKEGKGEVDVYVLAPGFSVSFNQIYTDSWPRGGSDLFSENMLILNFCRQGRCDVSLGQNRYTIVKEKQICASTILPTKDFYYPGRVYEGIQIYIDRSLKQKTGEWDLLKGLGIETDQVVELFCGEKGIYLHRMNEPVSEIVEEVWAMKEEPETGMLRYLAVRLLHELMRMPCESESERYFTRSQIAIVKEAEALILEDLSRRITAKEIAERFGVSESSFKLYVKGILGESYLNYFRKKRMERAAELLESTNQKVIEVANAVGYENQGKFAKAFAEQYGMTPLEFRRLSR